MLNKKKIKTQIKFPEIHKIIRQIQKKNPLKAFYVYLLPGLLRTGVAAIDCVYKYGQLQIYIKLSSYIFIYIYIYIFFSCILFNFSYICFVYFYQQNILWIFVKIWLPRFYPHLYWTPEAVIFLFFFIILIYFFIIIIAN